MGLDRGLIYVAAGGRYLDEAEYSAGSFREHMRDIPIAVFTDDRKRAESKGLFDFVYEIEEPQYEGIDKVFALRRSPFERGIYLDSDTYGLNPCYELFDLLDRFDFAAAHSPVRESGCYPTSCPESFPEFNTGVIAFRKGQPFDDLIARWYTIHMGHRTQAQKRLTDQPAFREAVFRSNARFAVLTPEYNLRSSFSCFVGGNSLVKIIHDRGSSLARAIMMMKAHAQGKPFLPLVVDAGLSDEALLRQSSCASVGARNAMSPERAL